MSTVAALRTNPLQRTTPNYTPEHVTVRTIPLSPLRALALPAMFALVLAASALLDSARTNGAVSRSFLGAAIALLVWNAILFAFVVRSGRVLTLAIALRKQHYVQACAQGAVLLYWGWYWHEVYDSVHLIAAQLLFAYGCDILLAWSRRDSYTLGFGVLPVVFSINLFLCFKPEWFYLQFVMVALGFAAKDLIHWSRDGRETHIFNPSAFPLAIFAVALLTTDMSDITWGKDIAITQFFPPHMYLALFLIGLPGQFFFGVTSMTMSAVVTTYIAGLLYFKATGTYFFFDSYIPIAVFLGMHLLFTDPSTSPRTELGRVMFGVAYGLSTMVLYKALAAAGLPTYYDKLLQVPILNLSVKLFDRAARSEALRFLDPAAIRSSLRPRQRNVAYMSIWATVFVVLSTAGGVGDAHPGQWVPFWQKACEADRRNACAYLATMHATSCRGGSGWACNEFALLQNEYEIDEGPSLRESLEAGCALGFRTACDNRVRLNDRRPELRRAPPTLDDYPVLLRGSKGPIVGWAPERLHARACKQGWPDACAGAGN